MVEESHCVLALTSYNIIIGKYLSYTIYLPNMGRTKGNTTACSLAVSKSDSLRTTVPSHIVNQFNLKPGSKLKWNLEAGKGRLKIIITPVKEEE